MGAASFAFLTTDQSRGDSARARLLAAALPIFADKGPRGASVREIARSAGQNVAAIAYYFGSKEKLYHALLEGIMQEVAVRVGEVLLEIETLKASGKGTPADGVKLFQKFLRTMYLRLLSRNEAIHLGRLIVREQLAPTAGFEILYRGGIKRLHQALSFTAGLALGRDPEDHETIARTHMLMGQIYFFIMTREAILRRLGWKDLEGEHATWVADLLEQHTDLLLTQLPSRLKNHSRRLRT